MIFKYVSSSKWECFGVISLSKVPSLHCDCHTLMIGHHFTEFVLTGSVPTGQQAAPWFYYKFWQLCKFLGHQGILEAITPEMH